MNLIALGEGNDILLCENGRGTYLFQFESFSGHGSKALVAAPKLVLCRSLLSLG